MLLVELSVLRQELGPPYVFVNLGLNSPAIICTLFSLQRGTSGSLILQSAQGRTQGGGMIGLSGHVWLGGAVVRALDLRLEVMGSIPATALSSATLDKLFTHIVQRLWCYNLMALSKSV